jgi:hypothetical protein
LLSFLNHTKQNLFRYQAFHNIHEYDFINPQYEELTRRNKGIRKASIRLPSALSWISCKPEKAYY